MRKRLISAALVLGMFLGMFAACKSEEAKNVQEHLQLEWSKKTMPMRGYEGAVGVKPKCFETTIYDKVKYCFDEERFDEKRAKAFIKKESKLVSYADKIVGAQRDGEEIILDRAVDGKYINLEDGLNYDALWQGLNRVHKMTGLEQYGLLYLYCKENNLINEKDNVDEKTLGEYFSQKENQFLLDFCIPMADTAIFEEEQVQMTKMAAKSFAKWYVKAHSLKDYKELCGNLKSCHRRELEKEKNKWLKDIGCKAKYTEFAKVFVKQSDCVYDQPDHPTDPADYEIEEEDAVWVWYSKDVKRIGWQEMVRKYMEYEPLRKKDFAEAREFLKDYLPDDVGKAKLVLDYHHQKGTNGIMEPTTLMIKTNRCWENTASCLFHEYIHYLTLGEGKIMDNSFSRFCVEGVAEWLASYQLGNREYELCRQYMADGFNKEGVDGKKWAADMLELDKSYIMYDIYMQNFKDKSVRSSKHKSSGGLPYPVDIDRMYYAEYGCILKYVYETYGMEKTITLLKSNADFEKVLGKTLDELYFETADFVKEEMQKMEAAYKEKTSR
ncbi:MAG: hypothetical protein E7280_03235 [Lachnospiraceae bacterium]|nr:hypothetical protein [Lachnospiraceae bacterium]